MHIELHTSLLEIPVDEITWSKIASLNITKSIFQTYEWFTSWWDIYGKNHNLIFLTAYENNEIVAFAPLMMTKTIFSGNCIKFAGDGNSDYCDFFIKGNRIKYINAFLEFIINSDIKWSSISLNNIPNRSTTRSCIETYCMSTNLYIQVKKSTPTPTLLLKKDNTSLQKLINKYSISRHVNKLKNYGDLKIDHLTNKNSITSHINTFFDQHINRYNYKNTKSLFEFQKNKDFYLKLIDNFDSKNWLVLSVLSLNDKPIAYHFGFIYDGVFIWYKPSFDMRYRKYSPSTVLLKYLIEYSVENSLEEFDFTIGDEKFKSKFSNLKRENHNISIYKSWLHHKVSLTRCLLSFVFNHIKIKIKY